MGLFTGLVTLPLAPVRGVMWLAETLTEQAEAQLYDPGRIAAEMQQIADEVAEGEITEEEAAAREEDLIRRAERGPRPRLPAGRLTGGRRCCPRPRPPSARSSTSPR
ncbi:gas vesicle protein GvpG [Actinomadura madurae]|uniref:gas vesicle protein GvpG n=1 Tax=Actinomadura madurae TaxID=1993 RepID=UPI0020D20ED0|nr:gas vesicle protein GvpG [Actinomadura madurae]MCP9976977.1 gas vesicle protein GvpG [Actinomadura madurae]